MVQKAGASLVPAPKARVHAKTAAGAPRIGEFSLMRSRRAARPSFPTRVGCETASDGQIHTLWTTVEMWIQAEPRA